MLSHHWRGALFFLCYWAFFAVFEPFLNVRFARLGLTGFSIVILANLSSLCLGPALQFFRRYVLDVGGHPPLVAEGVLHAGRTIPVKLVGGFAQGRCTGRQRAPVGVVDVFQIDMKHAGH